MGNPTTGGSFFGGSRLPKPQSTSVIPPEVNHNLSSGMIESLINAPGGVSPTRAGDGIIGTMIDGGIANPPTIPPMNPPMDNMQQLVANPPKTSPQPPALTAMQPMTPTPTPSPTVPTTPTLTQAPMRTPRRKAGPKRPQLGTPGQTGTRPISMF